MQKYTPAPTIGAIVHYVAYGTPGGEFKPAHRAAIVTEVLEPLGSEQRVRLCILNPTGMFFSDWLPHDGEDRASGTWHWPEAAPQHQGAI